MALNEVRPILKWAGGKSKLIPQLEEKFPIELKKNEIKTYIEPFVGGGAMLFYLAGRYNFEKIVINDINSGLTLTYRVVKDNLEELMNVLEKLQNDFNHLQSQEEKKEFYLNIRELFNKSKNDIDYVNIDKAGIIHAAHMIFLNKSCFNGLYRENKKGGFNVPFGQKNIVNTFDRKNIINVSNLLKNAIILNGDFEGVEEHIDDHTFIYMDPPYRPLNATSNFKDYSKEEFNDESQIRLANFCNNINRKYVKLMLSNSDPKNSDESDIFFDKLYKEFNIHRVCAARSINSNGSGRGKVSEILVTNY